MNFVFFRLILNERKIKNATTTHTELNRIVDFFYTDSNETTKIILDHQRSKTRKS